MSTLLSAAKVEDAINHIRFFADHDIGTQDWVRAQKKVVSLSKQVSLGTTKLNEERIIQPLARLEKIHVLAMELNSAHKWRVEMFWRPYIRALYRKMPPEQRARYDSVQSRHPFRLYPFRAEQAELPVDPPADGLAQNMFIYENAVLKLMNAALLHRWVFLQFKDDNLEMTRYVCDAVEQLLFLAEVRLIQHDFEIDNYGTEYIGMKRICLRLMSENGMLCLSILRNMLENADLLHPSAFTLLVESNRAPLLLCLVLHFKPWQRYTSRTDEVFNGQTWTTVHHNVHRHLSLVEKDAWLGLAHCFLQSHIRSRFEMTPDLLNHLGLIKKRITVSLKRKLPTVTTLKGFMDSVNIEDTNFTPSSRVQLPEALPIAHFGVQGNPVMQDGF